MQINFNGEKNNQVYNKEPSELCDISTEYADCKEYDIIYSMSVEIRFDKTIFLHGYK